jgi:DNA polymerase V
MREWEHLNMSISAPIPFEKRTILPLPLVSAYVEAGFPSPADDHLERSIDLNEELVRNPAATFYVRVKGESMRDAGIHPGDLLMIDRSITPADRQIVIAMIDGEFTVKRFRKRNGKITLEAENPAFQPIEVDEDQELIIWGVVTYIIHEAR